MTPSTPTTRHPEWQRRWDALRSERAETPFTWGVADCCLWAADAVQAVAGWDPAADWRGTYSTAAQAARLLASHGGLRGLACAALGDAVSPLWATVGDVVLIEQPHADAAQRELLAVCNGTSAIAQGADGLVAFGMGSARCVWKV